jgi:hypothetical protein
VQVTDANKIVAAISAARPRDNGGQALAYVYFEDEPGPPPVVCDDLTYALIQGGSFMARRAERDRAAH